MLKLFVHGAMSNYIVAVNIKFVLDVLAFTLCSLHVMLPTQISHFDKFYAILYAACRASCLVAAAAFITPKHSKEKKLITIKDFTKAYFSFVAYSFRG